MLKSKRKLKDDALIKELPSNTSALSNNDVVYVLDPEHKYVFLFGNASDIKEDNVLDLNDELHLKYHKKAISGYRAVYNWSVESCGRTCYFQSTLIPIFNDRGKTAEVLGIVKNINAQIDALTSDSASRDIVRDNRGKTFAQILMGAREEEKRQISSSLHDELGSAAVILNSMLGIIEADVKENNKKSALAHIKEFNKKLDRSLEKLKNVVVSLRPPNLEGIGLEGALEDLVDSTRTNTGMDIEFKYVERAHPISSEDMKIMLYRVVQESLSNVIKHSHATKVLVSLENLESNIILQVKDNGAGFKVASARSIKSMGIHGMRERVKYLGGKFEIKSALGKGTLIRVTCPKVVYTVDI
ncbi:Histidine kinase [Parelusimicrobium proximum]|uniref:sensor histidine kinase n=1 Tax=Parelusimicrobium proximum TaxID=3228953 RepID=UPI003D17C237